MLWLVYRVGFKGIDLVRMERRHYGASRETVTLPAARGRPERESRIDAATREALDAWVAVRHLREIRPTAPFFCGVQKDSLGHPVSLTYMRGTLASRGRALGIEKRVSIEGLRASGASHASELANDLILGVGGEWLADPARLQSRAHYYLAEARRKVFGTSPDATGGWHDAVRAVEVLACRVVLPSDGRATLGKVIRTIRDRPNAWRFTLGSPLVLAEMADSVWRSDVRHGNDDPDTPLEANIRSAEAAFHVAAALVQLLSAGHLRASER